MNGPVDELFGQGGGAATPRSGLAMGLLGGGVLLALIGGLCTSIPGGALVLLAWFVVQRDLDRLESGYLPADHRQTVRTLQVACTIGLVLVVLLEIFQMFFSTAIFDWLLAQLAMWLPAPDIPPP